MSEGDSRRPDSAFWSPDAPPHADLHSFLGVQTEYSRLQSKAHDARRRADQLDNLIKRLRTHDAITPRLMPAIRRSLNATDAGDLDALRTAEMFWIKKDALQLITSAAHNLPEMRLHPSMAPAPVGLLMCAQQVTGALRSWPTDAYRQMTGIPVAEAKLILGTEAPKFAGMWWRWHGESLRLGLVIDQAHIFNQSIDSALASDDTDRYIHLTSRALDRIDTFGRALTLCEIDLPLDSAQWPAQYQRFLEWMMTAWLLMTQDGMTSSEVMSHSAGERKKASRAGRTLPEIRLIDLRKGSGGSRGGSVAYVHRWTVRGHWRQQPFGPGRSQRRPVFIAAHLKGPEGAPLLAGEKIHVWRG